MTELDALLADWADQQRLSPAQASSIRHAVVHSSTERRAELEADWLWDLMRPVTDLLDGPHRLHDMLTAFA